MAAVRSLVIPQPLARRARAPRCHHRDARGRRRDVTNAIGSGPDAPPGMRIPHALGGQPYRGLRDGGMTAGPAEDAKRLSGSRHDAGGSSNWRCAQGRSQTVRGIFTVRRCSRANSGDPANYAPHSYWYKFRSNSDLRPIIYPADVTAYDHPRNSCRPELVRRDGDIITEREPARHTTD